MINLQRIKWENIATAIGSVFVIERLLRLITDLGNGNNARIEIVLYFLAVMGVRTLIKDLRTNKTNWLIEKK